MSTVVWLDQISKSDLSLVGGKGANLGEMFRVGFPVPRGFCITTSAYRRQVEETAIGCKLASSLAGPRDYQALSEALEPLFLNSRIVPEIETEIRGAYDRIREGVRVAVRSSATAEDLPEASFAGQQETFLGISGVEALLLAVRRCWASLWSSRAIHYREKQGINHSSVALAVVVQEMVAADVAGVMFTINPVTGAADEAVITASYGLGEAVVSGSVIPDTYVVSKQRLTISKRDAGRKESKVVQEGQGTAVVPVPVAEQNELCLSDAMVMEITRAGLNVERHYGEPQDIEWAVAGGRVYVLQARPVTGLPGAGHPALPGLADDVYGWIYVGRMPWLIRRRLLLSIPDHFPRPLRPFDISCSMAAALDGGRRVAAELGIRLPPDVARPHESGLVLFNPPVPSVFRIVLRLPFMWRQLKEWTRYDPRREWRDVDEPALRPMLPAAPSSEMTTEQLLAGIDRLRGAITELMYRRFRKYMAAGAAAHRRLKILLRKLYRDEADLVKQRLMLSLDHKTALANQAMKDLAKSAASIPAVREILTTRPFGAMHAAILADPRCGAFAGQLVRFLAEFGHRTALTMEPQPSYPSWADEPDQVLGLIATTIRHPDSLVDHTVRDEEAYRRTRTEIAGRLAGKPRLAAQFEWAVDTARSFVVAREASLYFLEEVVSLIRTFADRLAERLVSAGRLPEARSIFFLLPYELKDLVAGERVQDIRSLLEQRQIAWERMRESWDRPPPQRGETRQSLKGAPVSQGVAIGAVKVIRGADEFHKLKPGDILVCPSTTPAWTPLFSVAAAVVADAGGPLSHAAIVAREYGIPAVMGCAHATNTLADGEQVEVNGTSGLVRRLSPVRDRALGPVQDTSATSASRA